MQSNSWSSTCSCNATCVSRNLSKEGATSRYLYKPQVSEDATTKPKQCSSNVYVFSVSWWLSLTWGETKTTWRSLLLASSLTPSPAPRGRALLLLSLSERGGGDRILVENEVMERDSLRLRLRWVKPREGKRRSLDWCRRWNGLEAIKKLRLLRPQLPILPQPTYFLPSSADTVASARVENNIIWAQIANM